MYVCTSWLGKMSDPPRVNYLDDEIWLHFDQLAFAFTPEEAGNLCAAIENALRAPSRTTLDVVGELLDE